jgi:hypothetical protein
VVKTAVVDTMHKICSTIHPRPSGAISLGLPPQRRKGSQLNVEARIRLWFFLLEWFEIPIWRFNMFARLDIPSMVSCNILRTKLCRLQNLLPDGKG